MSIMNIAISNSITKDTVAKMIWDAIRCHVSRKVPTPISVKKWRCQARSYDSDSRRHAALNEQRNSRLLPVGKVRGPLHGAPIIFKDNIETGPNSWMDTTARSIRLVGAESYQEASLVKLV
ncbi:hypothetical protein GGS24DRAFT_179357 [Hypoxylon argillaceum]|nr:hypothetical protein GGS24DRAFT_179357 [Hypoxylon argillaceum]